MTNAIFKSLWITVYRKLRMDLDGSGGGTSTFSITILNLKCLHVPFISNKLSMRLKIRTEKPLRYSVFAGEISTISKMEFCNQRF